MKSFIEEYGKVTVTLVVAVVLFLLLVTVRPLYNMTGNGGDLAIVEFEPGNLALSVKSVETNDRTVSPLELLDESLFDPDEWEYQTTAGNRIYFQNANRDNLIFMSRYGDSGSLNYNNVVVSGFGAYVDEVTIILNHNSISKIARALVIIKE